MSRHSFQSRPARMLRGGPALTSLRVSEESADALATIRSHVQEWLLSHSLKEYKEWGLKLTIDQALRIVLATFARDYSIPMPKEAKT